MLILTMGFPEMQCEVYLHNNGIALYITWMAGGKGRTSQVTHHFITCQGGEPWYPPLQRHEH